MSRPSGPRWQRLAAWIIRRDHGVCWLCGHTGADTADHIIPYDTRPDLAWTTANLKAAHGTRRTISTDGYECIGNYGRGNKPAPRKSMHSRKW